MNIADKILLLRKREGISQEELANQLNTSRQAISKWENGQSTPDLDKIVALSKYFNVTTDELLTDSIKIEATLNKNQYEDNTDFQKLKSEVTEAEYQYALNEAEKKKHFSYWFKIIVPFIMILVVLIYYYFYRG